MVWLIAFAVLAGAWFTASFAMLLVNRAMVQRTALTISKRLRDVSPQRTALTISERLIDVSPLPVPASIISNLRTMASCECSDCRNFWIDYGQEIQTLATEATVKAIEAATKAETVN
ncbi:MAG: hypothetical protein HC888_06445 [Candidatus Competibacteraceae bacterium]|nr:hypothetical protein [Candidatus Competibacteraceae bacterium]